MSASSMQSDALPIPVFVAGGGMVGLTLACALAGAGVEVAVVDRDPPDTRLAPEFDGRVSAIAGASKRLLEMVGVWEGMAAHAQPILDIRVSDRDSLFFLHYDHREVGAEPFGYIVENRVIRTALLARARSLSHLRLIAPATLTHIERNAQCATVTLSTGERIAAQLLVGAEGRHSPLRDSAGIGTVTASYPHAAIVCTIAHERPHHGLAQERFLPAGPFAALPMTGNRSSLVWTERAEAVGVFLALPDADLAAEIQERVGGYLGGITVSGPRFSYPLGVLHAKSYIAQRLALVGDAAHTIHPIAGQGVNLGFRDAAALAELVVDNHRLGLDVGTMDALRHYQRWRRLDNLLMLAVTDGLNRVFLNESLPIQAARRLGLWAVGRTPPLKRFFMRHAMGLTGDLPRLIAGRPL